MMKIRFRQFLEEQNSPYDVDSLQDVTAVIGALHKHCSASIGRGNQIWRGSKTAHKSAIFHPGTGKRGSRNISNYYTVLLDTNPLNSEFPERAKSLIASTSKAGATSYAHWSVLDKEGRSSTKEGSVLALFPFDGTKVGVINKSDIWQCKLEFNKSLHMQEGITSMNDFWQSFMQAIDRPNEIPTMEQLIRLIYRHPNEVFKELEDASYIGRNEDKNVVEKFAADIPDAYSFETMGCEVATAGNVRAERSEVWFSGSCVAAAPDHWNAIAEEFGL